MKEKIKNNIVAIILARRGSKGLLNKNIALLDGKPLISYSIECAKQSKYIDRIIVSTDDHKIQEVANKYGAETPFLRPKMYSGDSATSETALRHAVEWLSTYENYSADIVVYLQITDLFRTVEMIDLCVEALINDHSIDSAFMGLIMHKNIWRKIGQKYMQLADDIPYGLPRQEKEPLYREDPGIALATRKEVVLSGRRIGENCKIVPYEQDVDFIDIHTEFDLWLSEVLITKRGIKPNN